MVNLDRHTVSERIGQVNAMKSRIRSTWPNVTEDDLTGTLGDLQEIVRRIRRRTGETLESIRQRLAPMMREV